MPLSNAQLEQFREDGFVIVREFFRPQRLEPVMAWIDRRVEELAERLRAAGKINDKHDGEGFYTRLTKLDQESPGAAVLIHIGGVLGRPLAELWSCPELLEVVEQILGPEVAGHPVWNLRSKTPNNPLLTVPWHQDTAYLAAGAERTLQPTAWIPLIDAAGVNGTLQVLRGGGRSGEVFRHRPQRMSGHPDSWYLEIDEADLPPGEVVTCEMEMGSLLLIDQLIPHRSTENLSDRIRWSIDLRWQRPGEPSGIEGGKDCIRMRSAADPDYRIDWSGWAERSRHEEIAEGKKTEVFDATVSGPWLARWLD